MTETLSERLESEFGNEERSKVPGEQHSAGALVC